MTMEQVLPDVFHWTARHPNIRTTVHSFYVGGPTRAVIDPMIPDEGGLDALRFDEGPRVVLLTCRHHYRASGAFAERFGVPVRANEAGLHEFDGTERRVEGFAPGDEVAPDLVAIQQGAIAPDDTVLHLRRGHGALFFADGLINHGELAYVLDQLLGDDPEADKKRMTAALARLLDLDFDHLLFAHGTPLIGGGKAALTAFVESRRG
jgi:hypothetical protein